MNSQEIRHSFCAHVVLYAKGWYKKTSIIDDLKELLSKWSEIDVKSISENDIREFIVETFSVTVRPHLQSRVLTEALGWTNLPVIMKRKPEEVLLGAISICDGEWTHKDLILKDYKD